MLEIECHLYNNNQTIVFIIVINLFDFNPVFILLIKNKYNKHLIYLIYCILIKKKRCLICRI